MSSVSTALAKREPITGVEAGNPEGLSPGSLHHARYIDGVRVKKCGRCGEWKPYADGFYLRAKKGASATLRQSICKDCKRRISNERRRANPKRENARQLARHNERMKDPEYAAKMKAQWRAQYEKRRQQPGFKERQRETSAFWRRKNGQQPRNFKNKQQPGVIERLPVAPFKEWVNSMLAKGITGAELCRVAGRNDRALRRVMSEGQPHVELDYADALLTAWDMHLLDLWPDLYD